MKCGNIEIIRAYYFVGKKLDGLVKLECEIKQ
jgi:hypothetical protein